MTTATRRPLLDNTPITDRVERIDPRASEGLATLCTCDEAQLSPLDGEPLPCPEP